VARECGKAARETKCTILKNRACALVWPRTWGKKLHLTAEPPRYGKRFVGEKPPGPPKSKAGASLSHRTPLGGGRNLGRRKTENPRVRGAGAG